MIFNIIISIFVLITFILVLLSIYSPDVFGIKEVEPVSDDKDITTTVNKIVKTVNSLNTKITGLEEKIDANKASISSLKSNTDSTLSSSDLEELKAKIQTISNTYVDKTKPVGILSGSCSGDVCKPDSLGIGNSYRALTFNDKKPFTLSDGNTFVAALKHSKNVPTNHENQAYTQWYLKQEYPKPKET